MICKRCEQYIPYNSRSKFLKDLCRHCSTIWWRENAELKQNG